jgi:serine/threonine protein kinase
MSEQEVIALITPDPIEAVLGEELAGEFEVLDRLPDGRWGPRFRARDLHRSEVVILSTLPLLEADDLESGIRFAEAMRTVSLLDHPHAVPITGYGVSGPLRWYTVTAHDDGSLAEHLEHSGALSLAVTRRIACQVAAALDQAHRRGLVHGALDTGAILIDSKGWVRVGEIGIADAIAGRGAKLGAQLGRGDDQVAFSRIVTEALTAGLEGSEPPGPLPPRIRTALERAASPEPRERFRDLIDFANALDELPVTRRANPAIHTGAGIRAETWESFIEREIAERPAPAPTPPRRRSRLPLLALALVALAIPIVHQLRGDPEPTTPPAARGTPAPSVSGSAAPVTPRPVAVTPPPRPAPTPVRTPAPTIVAPVTPRPTLPEQFPLAPPTMMVLEEGLISVSSFPWGELSIDGRPVGTTPQIDIVLPPGTHRIRIARDGYQPYEAEIDLKPGARLLLTQIGLQELKL